MFPGSRIDEIYERTQAFIQVIHSAPSLENLLLGCAMIKIADVENLHARSTKLKHLGFMNVDIYTNDVENQIVNHPSDTLKSFSIKYISPIQPPGAEEEQQTIDGAIKNWISYIGRKYLQLRDLRLYLNPYASYRDYHNQR